MKWYEALNSIYCKDMFVLHNITQLERGKPWDSVIRNSTESFWQTCIDRVDRIDNGVSYRVGAYRYRT